MSSKWITSRQLKLLIQTLAWSQLEQKLPKEVGQIKMDHMIRQSIYLRLTILICFHNNQDWASHFSLQMLVPPISTKSLLKLIIWSKFKAWRARRKLGTFKIKTMQSINLWTWVSIWKHRKLPTKPNLWFLKRTWWRGRSLLPPSINWNTWQIFKVGIKVAKSFSILICKHLVNFQMKTLHGPRSEKDKPANIH